MYQTDSGGVQTAVPWSALSFLFCKFQVSKIKLDSVYEMPRASSYLIYFDMWINIYTKRSYWSGIRASKWLQSSTLVNWIYLVNALHFDRSWVTWLWQEPRSKILTTLELPHILLFHKLELFCLSRINLTLNFSVNNTFHILFLLSMIEFNYTI